MKTHILLASLTTMLLLPRPVPANDATMPAAQAINTLGIELLKKTEPGRNALLSPYSIQNALAMTYAGADGKTREEMAKTLHFPNDDAVLNKSFLDLQNALSAIEKNTAKITSNAKYGGPTEPVTLSVANRLFGQAGFEFRKPFLETVKEDYGAPLEEFDFVKAAPKAVDTINAWVSEQTHKRIQNLIPKNGLTPDTRIVLVNAIYMKAAWENEFQKYATKPAGFRVNGGEQLLVATMHQQFTTGYAKREGYAVATLPYVGSELQFVVLLPDDPKGLDALEAKLTPEMLAGCAKLEPELLDLALPKFKLEPPLMLLGDALKKLGMKTAFDMPKGSANFNRMAPRKGDDYLYISEVFHKTFLALDENGTEAAAATAVAMMAGSAAPANPPKPVAMHVDRPFLFAIQHRASGACLFLGRVTDPK